MGEALRAHQWVDPLVRELCTGIRVSNSHAIGNITRSGKRRV
jgi:hypothetical protein